MPRCRVSRYPNNLPRYSPDDGAGGGYRDIWFKLSRTAGWNGRAEEAGHSPRQSENKLHTYLPRVSRQWCTHAKLSLEVLEKLGEETKEGEKRGFLKKKRRRRGTMEMRIAGKGGLFYLLVFFSVLGKGVSGSRSWRGKKSCWGRVED